ncbi:MAG: LysR family transcriptional regulator [Oscillospiraceae bacterium]
MGFDKVFQTNLDYYRTFYHVVKSGSISLAANRLSLSQPTVTKAVQRLEEDLQCKLLQRSHNGVVLTAEGEALWARLQPACDMIIEAEQELALFRSLDKGTINIASYETGLQIYILPAVREFVKAYPKIQINLLTKQPEEMFSLLRSGLIDAALVFSPVVLDDIFETQMIDEFEDSLIVGKSFSFLTQREYTMKELAQYPFISYSSAQSLRAFLQQCFQKIGMTFEPQMEVGSQALMIQAIEDGLGIGSVPHRAILKQLEDGKLFRLRLKEAMPTRQVLSVTNRNNLPGRPAQVFLEKYLPHFAEFELL